MKNALILLFLFFSPCVYGQFFWSENFDNPADPYLSRFVTDTINYHHNLWQIGRPHKIVFDTASPFSLPNVIITDTLNPVAENDTSVFTIRHMHTFSPGFTFSFYYQLDIDSGDIAKVEVSGDNGLNWINLITQDTAYMFYWGLGGKPRLDTSNHSWQYFQVGMDTWMNAYAGGPDSFAHYRTSDTVLFRFTFVSDSDTTRREGWMMDDFNFENAVMEGGITTIPANNMITVYPIPSAGSLYIRSGSQAGSVEIFNLMNEEVYSTANYKPNSCLKLDLPNGTYYLRYTSGNRYCVKKIVIVR